MYPDLKQTTLFILSLLAYAMDVFGEAPTIEAYPGYTFLSKGTLSFPDPTVLPNALDSIVFTSGMAGGTASTLQFTAPLIFQNPILIGKGFEAVIDLNGNRVKLYSSVSDLTSGGHLEITGGNVLTLYGDASHSGQTIVDSGTTLQAGAKGVFSPYSPFQLDGVIDLNHFDQKIPTLIGGGEVILGRGNLTLTHPSANSTFNGVIKGEGGVNLEEGTLALAALSTYQGITRVGPNGILVVAVDQPIPTTAQLEVNGVLDLHNGYGADSDLTVQALSGFGSIHLGTTGQKTFTVLGKDKHCFRGTIEGRGNLTVGSPQIYTTLQLVGPNTYEGVTQIFGTLQADASTALSKSSTYQVELGATLDLNGHDSVMAGIAGEGTVLTRGASLTVGAGTFSGALLGQGSLIKDSEGTVSLLGRNNLSTFTIQEGILEVSSPSSLGESLLIFHPGHSSSLRGQITFLGEKQTFTQPISIADHFTAVLSGRQTTIKGNISDVSTGGQVEVKGVVTFSGDNSYTGPTTVEASSSLHVGSPTALSPFSSFDVEGTLSLGDEKKVDSSTIGSLKGGGKIDLGKSLLTIVNGQGETFSGQIIGSGSICLKEGELTLSGSENVFSGPTVIEDKGILVADRPGSLSPLSPINLQGRLNVGETECVIPSISGDGLVYLGETGTGALRFTAPTVFDGNISGAGSLSFASGKNGLNGKNTYSGPTTVLKDSLTAGSTTAFSPHSDFIVEGLLDVGSYNHTIGSLSGSGQVDLGTLGNTFTIANGKGFTFTGDLTGEGGLRLQHNTLVLAPKGTHRYSGPTTIDAGATLCAGSENPFSATSPFLVNGTFSLYDGINDYSATIRSIEGNNPEGKIDLGSIGEAILTINGSVSSHFPGTVEGKGGLEVGPNTQLSLSGRSYYEGKTLVLGEMNGYQRGSFSPLSPFIVDGNLNLNQCNNTLLSLSGSGLVDLGLDRTTVLTVCGGDFSGHIVGAGQLIIDAGEGTFTLEGDNSYTAGTTIQSGTLALKGSGTIPFKSPLNFAGGGTFDIQQISRDSFKISDLIGGNGSSKIVLGDKKLYVGTARSTTFRGTFEGEGAWVKQGSGTITLKGTAKNLGGIEIKSGQVVGDATNIQNSIQVDRGAYLTFHQTEKGTFQGRLTGPGRVIKTGTETLYYDTKKSDVSQFTGITIVKEGQLCLNTELGGSLHVLDQGTLSGSGALKENLTLNRGGTIAPDHRTGPLQVFGNYVQNGGSRYLVHVDRKGKSSAIDVKGAATLGGELIVSSLDKRTLVHHPFTILHADGGIFQTFDTLKTASKAQSLLYAPKLTYRSQDLFLEFTTAFINGAKNANQREVALALDSMVDPDPEQAALLTAIASLPQAEASSIFQQLSGQQQTVDLFAAELVNRAFLRRLYDPIRNIVTTLPCFLEPSPCGWTGWIEGGWDRSSLDDNHEASGFQMYGGQITVGVQKEIFESFTAGFATSYVFDKLDFREEGKGWMNHALIGLYAVFRPESFYLLADLLYGYSHHNISRQVFIPGLTLDLTSHPVLNQVTTYLEGGFDLPCGRLLFQPFVAFEVGGVWRNRVEESGGGDFDLLIEEREDATAFSRLGLHVTTNGWPLIVSLDAAWQCRLTENPNCIWERFSAFGSPFNIQGITVDRNTFQGAVTLSYPLSGSILLFAEGGGEAWRNASTFSFTFGLTTSW